MSELSAQFVQLKGLLQANLYFVLSLLAALWAIFIVNFLLGYRLCYLGIVPRSLPGLIGIAFAPFLHGNFNHLFFNMVPLFVLSSLVLVQGKLTFYCVTLVVVVLSGAGIWLFGRKALHVGASGVIMGYWGYLLLNAYQQPSVSAILLVAVTIYYFGGMLMSVFPTEGNISWEGHLFGFLSGLAANYLCPYIQPMLLS